MGLRVGRDVVRRDVAVFIHNQNILYSTLQNILLEGQANIVELNSFVPIDTGWVESRASSDSIQRLL